MSKPFKAALKAFLAAKYNRVLGDVRIVWDEGCDVEGSYWEPATFRIEFRDTHGQWITEGTNESAVDLLHELLAWEDGS